jgi:hypothetical protein
MAVCQDGNFTVKLQAGVDVHLARKRGEEVLPALIAAQEASGEAIREPRATVEILRTNEPTGTWGRRRSRSDWTIAKGS